MLITSYFHPNLTEALHLNPYLSLADLDLLLTEVYWDSKQVCWNLLEEESQLMDLIYFYLKQPRIWVLILVDFSLVIHFKGYLLKFNQEQHIFLAWDR